MHPDADQGSRSKWPLGVANAWIHRAEEGDLAGAVEILEEAAEWTARLGLPSWEPGGFRSPSGRGRTQLTKALLSGGLYVARIGEEAAATVSLLDRDVRFWPGARPDALYVHKLAVSRRYARRGVGRAILEWAAEEARERGKQHLRLDCSQEDPRIRAYYEDAGFRHHGDLTVDAFPVALYERHV
jgi:GNAT superfamily N-acetyltransferase